MSAIKPKKNAEAQSMRPFCRMAKARVRGRGLSPSWAVHWLGLKVLYMQVRWRKGAFLLSKIRKEELQDVFCMFVDVVAKTFQP